MSVGGREPGSGAGETLFLAAYVLVFVSAFVALTPILQIVTPLHADAIDPADKTRVLSQAMFWGAVTAAISNVVVGALSDRTRSRFGRRRPWIAAGGVLIVLAYVGIWRSQTPLQLTWAVVGFQAAFNVLMAPLLALFAERVSLARRTTMSAILGVCYPLAVALGSGLMALGPQGEAGRLVLLALVILTTTWSFVLLFAEPASPVAMRRPAPASPAPWALLRPFRSRNFVLVWSGRLLLSTGYALVGAYLLYFIVEAFSSAGRTPEVSHSILTAVALAGVFAVAMTVAFAGRRIRSRKPVALCGAVLLCGASAAVAASQDWAPVVGAFVIYGLGQGAYGSVEMGLMADVLPTEEDRGKDMGLINLAAALPQAIAPLIAVWLQSHDGGIRPLFGVAALCFGSAALLLAGLKAMKPSGGEA
ncbi:MULTISPECIES: MFS transporter [Brevundimonas]|uniref:MFS transporter n=1 Tax=Brevundimonas albigilva TaxID=1312364 RepID=A0ABY4STH3_9CAUL|nr:MULTISPECIES: MFS transporter [Brevundimonas]URI15970.1 MFS transporter [Brevundimonas albigilva]